MLKVDVISDTVCPWCFIGKRRLEAALAMRPDIKTSVEWRPFQLNPQITEAGLPRQEYLEMKFGGPERARKIYDGISQVGKDDGIEFRFEQIRRQPNTLAAHRLIKWAGSAGRQDAVVELLFRRYFFEGQDVGDKAVLIDIAEEAGMDRQIVADLYAQGADEELVLREESVARSMGIAGVPCFIIESKYAVSGAQDASVLCNVLDLAVKEKLGTPTPQEPVA